MKHNLYLDDPEHDIVGSCPHDLFYLAPTPPSLDSIYIQLNRAGIVMRTPEDFFITRDDSYRYCLLHCIFRGRGSVSVRGHTVPVSAGQLFLLGANEGHMYASDPDDPLSVVWAEFCGGNSTQLVAHILDLGGPVYGGRVFSDTIEKCTSLLYQTRQYGPKISMLVYEMLMRICMQVETGSRQSPINYSILKYIDENINTRLTLGEVSAVFGYNPAYFSSLFSKMTGITFSKYVMNRKLSHTCYLLETTAWSVERISQELGFCDISHFIKRFKEAKGVTPSAYRAGKGTCRNIYAKVSPD